MPRPRGLKYPQLEDCDWLRAQYVDDGMTLNQIADLVDFDCSAAYVSYALKRAGIKARPPGVHNARPRPVDPWSL